MTVDDRAFAWHQAYQRGVLSRSQAVACGLSLDALRHRIRVGGPWQRLLPGIYLTSTGEPTREQLLIASLVYAGPDGLITGPAALANYRIRGLQTRLVDVLVPVATKRSDAGFVVVHRTRRMPAHVICDGPVRYAPPGRAVADWENTMARHARMSAAGIVVLHFSPRQQRDQPAEVIGTIDRALHAGRRLPAITTRAVAA